jgi:hypothetical protein
MATQAKSVQARDADSVVQFYENRAVPAFSIRQGSQLIYAYEGESMEAGADLLANFIEDFIIIPRSAAIYTLCVHNDPKGAISNKTEYNGSINFRFFDYADMYGSSHGNNNNVPASISPALESKINGIAAGLEVMKKKMEGFEKPADEGSKLGVIGEILDHPLGYAIGKALIEGFIPGARVPEPAAISGTGFETMEETHQKLNEALTVLIQQEPDFPVYLYNLSQVAKNDPKKFQGFMGMIKMYL